MASKLCATTALLLYLNLLTMVSATNVPCPPPPVKPRPPVKPPCGGCAPVYPSCPRDALKLGVCADVLNILKLKIGSPPKYPCCSLLEGLVDLEAAVCLCTAIKANILGINLNIPIDLSLLLNYCGKTTCAMCILSMLLISVALPAVHAAGRCNQTPPTPAHSPHVKKPPKHTIPHPRLPVVGPPVVVYPPPAVVNPPMYENPPTRPSGGVPATIPPPSTAGRCSIDVLKLGLCLDVLRGLLHLGIRPVENVCCPVLQGLLEAEAAVCLCTALKLRILNLNIYIPLALNVLVTCGKDPPPGADGPRRVHGEAC
ncbi:hypothetical protein Taro_052183 [Colocasia esculenta]|uniref:Bifunctional inhibitor/plant lipid transfer protein/seed storage helical domain-containing protein n=1 Tax=Colocasia esculenta TaxID=4460 RepID=A0A843XIZ0_COLES|nr:hypothetical protein [Colocasia esculenta]